MIQIVVTMLGSVLSGKCTLACPPKTRIDVTVGKLAAEYDVYRRIAEMKDSAKVMLKHDKPDFEVSVTRSDDMDASIHMSMALAATVGSMSYN
jgi:hypothetical protein